MKKQIMLLTLFFVCVSIMGSASAASDNSTYGIGANITQQAMSNTNLALNQSDDNLLITTASSAQLNNQSTEGSLQGVVDTTGSLSKGQAITYGSGNLLTINDPNGALWYLFVSKSGDNLMAQKYTVDETGTITSTGVWNIGTNQNSAQLQAAIDALGYNLVAIANLWAQGAPADLLAGTYTTGSIDAATISSYAMTRSFALTYPTGSNYVITTAGGDDDDTLIYGAFGFNEILFSTSSGTQGETAFINYNTNNNLRSGVLALMKENDLTSEFTQDTGITVVTGTLSEIEYDLWLLNKLNTNAASLFTVEALKSVDESNIEYLWYDDSLGYGHGIDKAYIASLNNAATTWNTNVVPVTNYDEMFALGQQAFNAAYNSGLFTAADLAAGNVAAVVAPYYTNLLNTYSLVGFIDGIVSAAQSLLTSQGYTNVAGFTIDNILQIRNPWTWGSNTGSTLYSVFVNVDRTAYSQTRNIADLVMSGVQIKSTPNTASFSTATTSSTDVGTTVAGKIVNANPSNIASGTVLGKNFAIPAVAGIAYAWAANAPYSYIRTIGHVGCICSTKEYDLALYLMGQYPLGANEQYILLALTASSETNRQISGRTTAYGVSPSLGTYYSMQSSNSADAVVLVIWNELTNTGRAMLIQYDSTAISAAMAAEGYTTYLQENDLFWHLDQVWNGGSDAGLLSSAITTVEDVTITQSQLNALTAAGQDPIEYMSYLASITPVNPVTPVNPSNPGTGSTGTGSATGNGLATVSGALNSAYNSAYSALSGLTATATTSATTSSSEIAPGLTVSSNTPAAPGAASTSASSGKSSIPIGVAVGAIILAIAAVLIYLGRNTITATIKNHKSEKLGK